MSHYDECARLIASNEEVLDVGAGKGVFACEMAKRGFKVSGIEINPAYVAQAQEKAQKEGVNISLTLGSAEKLPYETGRFAFANASEVTEHVSDPLTMCREIFRVLKPGGHAYVSFHNRFGVYDYHYHLYFINWMPRAWTEFVLKILKKQKPDGEAGRQKLTTMHYFTFGQVRKLLHEIGFTVEDIRVKKIKERFGKLSVILLPVYFTILRPLYFNTFHISVTKPQ